MSTEIRQAAASLLMALRRDLPALINVAPDYGSLALRIRAAQARELSVLFADNENLHSEFLELAARLSSQADELQQEIKLAGQDELATEKLLRIDIEIPLRLPADPEDELFVSESV